MKAPCGWEVIEEKTLHNLRTRTFARIFYILPSKLIGLKSFRQSAPFFLGIRIIKDAPAFLGGLLLEWKSHINAMITTLMTSQNHLKNVNGKPSRPSTRCSQFRSGRNVPNLGKIGTKQPIKKFRPQFRSISAVSTNFSQNNRNSAVSTKSSQRIFPPSNTPSFRQGFSKTSNPLPTTVARG